MSGKQNTQSSNQDFCSRNSFPQINAYILADLKIEVITNNDGSYDVTFEDKTYAVSAELKQEGERSVIVSVVDGVKTSASVVVMGQSVHLFSAVSLTICSSVYCCKFDNLFICLLL